MQLNIYYKSNTQKKKKFLQEENILKHKGNLRVLQNNDILTPACTQTIATAAYSITTIAWCCFLCWLLIFSTFASF